MGHNRGVPILLLGTSKKENKLLGLMESLWLKNTVIFLTL